MHDYFIEGRDFFDSLLLGCNNVPKVRRLIEGRDFFVSLFQMSCVRQAETMCQKFAESRKRNDA